MEDIATRNGSSDRSMLDAHNSGTNANIHPEENVGTVVARIESIFESMVHSLSAMEELSMDFIIGLLLILVDN